MKWKQPGWSVYVFQCNDSSISYPWAYPVGVGEEEGVEEEERREGRGGEEGEEEEEGEEHLSVDSAHCGALELNSITPSHPGVLELHIPCASCSRPRITAQNSNSLPTTSPASRNPESPSWLCQSSPTQRLRLQDSSSNVLGSTVSNVLGSKRIPH